MILLFTDYGTTGPYTGQVKAVLTRAAPNTPVVELMADAPSRDPRRAAYLLAALARDLPAGAIVLAVVDPGVGTPRGGVILQADGRWFVAPDNGLLGLAARQADDAKAWRVLLDDSKASATFHGRDIFAPMAAELARKAPSQDLQIVEPLSLCPGLWPDDLAEVLYIDGFGNAITGIRVGSMPDVARLHVAGQELTWARTFAEAEAGVPFWFRNAFGLAEIAVSMGNAADALGLRVGTAVAFTVPEEVSPSEVPPAAPKPAAVARAASRKPYGGEMTWLKRD